MNQDRIQNQWNQLTGKMKKQWGMLTEDDLQEDEGDTAYLVGKLQERYGLTRDEAKARVQAFEQSL